MEKNDRDTAGDTADENEDTDKSEKLLVLPLGEESKKITQVITNDTAREIMELLAERPMSATDMANKLDIPLTTIKYNIENLVEAGLIKIERIKYSEKGRQVKVYGPVRKLIVVVPERTDSASIVDVLKKYLGVIFAAIFASGLLELLTGPYGRLQSKMADNAPMEQEGLPGEELVSNASYHARDTIVGTANESIQKSFPNETVPPYLYEAADGAGQIASPAPAPGIVESVGTEPIQKAVEGFASHLGLWFLFGCLFIIAVLIITDYYRTMRKK